MIKVIAYVLIGLIWLTIQIVRSAAKAKKEAEAKRARQTSGPSATKASSFDDLLKKIREQQANPATSTGQTASRPEMVNQSYEVPSTEDQLETGKGAYTQSTLGKTSSGFGKETRNPVAPPASQTKAKTQSLSTGAKQPDHSHTAKPEVLTTAKYDAYQKKESAKSSIEVLLKDKQQLKRAFIFHTLLERKF